MFVALGALFASAAAAEGPPILTIESATGVTETAATLHGTINPNGSATTYEFSYAPQGSGNTYTEVKSLSAGSKPVSVSEPISSLEPSAVYSVRIWAYNEETHIITHSDEITFTTGPWSLCQENAALCPSGSIYPEGTELEAQLKSGTFVEFRGTLEERCTGSTLTAQTAANGAPLPIQITGLTLSGCSPCKTGEARNLPFNATVQQAAGGDGSGVITGSGKGNPQLEFSNGCPLSITCVFGGSEIPFELKGGNPATLVVASTKLTRKGGSFLCGESTTLLEAQYEITTPQPLFVTGVL